MPGRRKRDHHLPDRVYFHRGWHFYVDEAAKWHKLGKSWDRSAKEIWLELSEGKSPHGTVAKLLDDFVAHCEALVRAGKRAKRTLADNEAEARALKLVFGRMTAHLLTSRHVKSYLNKRNDKDGRPAPIRANREIALLSSAYAWAMGQHEWPKIALNPCYGVRRNAESPRREYVQTPQLVRFGRDFAPAWMRRYILVKRITGLRQGDILRLTPANVTTRGLELVTGKTNKRMRFRWTWGLRTAIDSIVASEGE
jgi:integrase